jgi:hypothetical protein
MTNIKDFFLSEPLNKSLVIIFLTIFSLNIFFMGLDYLDLIDGDFFFYGWLSVNSEYNPPAFFNGLLFFIIPFRIFQLMKDSGWKVFEKWGWLIIGTVFIFLGLDEIFQIHENQPESWNLESNNWFKYYLIGLGVISLPCIPLFFNLSSKIKALFILSGVVFLGGAVGLESASIYFSSNQLWKLHKIAALIEEFLEMLGLIIFSCSLIKLRNLRRN